MYGQRTSISSSCNPPGFSSYSAKLGSESEQISPSVVVIIIILTAIFFVSGCLHFLIRYFARVRNGSEEGDGDGNGAVSLGNNGMEGQLQQLFHLHDSGVEQALIDTMPVFLYKAVKGLRDGSDCPVCLSEFQPDDKLRLLPNCSHAFHVDCIDGWLLTHSTCPLCRGSLLQYFSNLSLSLPSSGPDLGFESGEESRDLTDREEVEDHQIQFSQVTGTDEPRLLQKDPCFAFACKILSENNDNNDGGSGVMIMPIKLGKFRTIDNSNNDSEGGSSSSNIRRSYSMGSYEYVIDPSSLQVFISLTPYSRKKGREKKLSLTPGHKPAFSECIAENMEISYPPPTPYEDFVSESRKLIKASDSHRWKKRDEVFVDIDSQVDNKLVSSSRRAFSFRIGMLDETNNGQMGGNRRSLSETQVFAVNSPPWESKSSEGEVVPQRSCEHSSSSSTSFARRTINWLVGNVDR